MPKTLVQLGRLGDVINVLPILQEVAREGRRATLCVASGFAGLLDGISYADPLIYRAPYDELAGAIQYAKHFSSDVAVSQIYGKGYRHERSSESFLRDSWNRVGRGGRWEQLSLCFDRRDAAREAALVAQIDFSKPVVALSLGGHSAPYAGAPLLLAELREKLPECNVLDLSTIVAERFYDLLGVFDRIQTLVTIDTGTLHLAKASAVPVVALIHPQPWYGSLRTSNHLVTRSYREVDPDEIVAQVRRTLVPVRNIVHAWPDWDMSGPDRARNVAARKTWEAEYARRPGGTRWIPCPVRYLEDLPRNSASDLQDLRPVPFVRDILRQALEKTSHRDDVVCLTNSDVGFTPGLTERMTRLVVAKGSAFCYRHDLKPDKVASGPISYLDAVSGGWCGGLDLFCFTRRWLKEHLDTLPDFVMGRTHWDIVLRDVVKRTGGGELYGSIYHEDHSSFWLQQPQTPGNLHNLALARTYLSKHDTTRPFRDTYR